MVYIVRCLFPHDRCVVKSKYSTTAVTEVTSEGGSKSIFLVTSDGRQTLNKESFGDLMGFTYTATLVCLHESDLRNIELFDLDVFDDAELLGWKLQLESGFVSDDVVVEYIGEHNGIDLGYGLFSSTTIIAGTFIGEYTGLLHSTRRYTPTTSMASRYAANYPSCDGGFEVDASEFGNVIRFINHSSTPNAQFRSVLLDGLAHIVCVSQAEISPGTQLTVDYGPCYWIGQGVVPVEVDESALPCHTV